ncbi:hypothetical protein LCGC14_1547300 [marine sediment metagenome]|uniref:Uncharacterized protein n=1 Tax=marine sediment metagenome TaxID=412755 RepID=A0A0F9LS70_9ZZZZ
MRTIEFCYMDVLNTRKITSWKSEENGVGYHIDDKNRTLRVWQKDSNLNQTLVMSMYRVEYVKMLER